MSERIFEGKWALVTGCNRGIGKAIIEKFASLGCNIIACVRNNSTDFQDFLSQLKNNNSIDTKTLIFDVTDFKTMEETIKTELIKEKVKVDILVNNAGMPHGGFLALTSIDKIKEVFEVNLFSQMKLTQLISKIMMRNKSGSIINIASVMGIDMVEGECAYGVSKAAVIAFTKTVAKELARFGIRVNAIAPGLIDTEMGAKMDEKVAQAMIDSTALKRMGIVDEIANTAVFLASDQSSYVTGQVLRVDGGM